VSGLALEDKAYTVTRKFFLILLRTLNLLNLDPMVTMDDAIQTHCGAGSIDAAAIFHR
jgi:hypothetical protein